MTEEFKPAEFKDNYRDALMEVINAKLEGEEIVEAPAPPRGKVVDLMSALKASVEAAKGRQPSEAPRRAASPSTARKRKAAAG
jgi:DNA end-binding protein Ku